MTATNRTATKTPHFNAAPTSWQSGESDTNEKGSFTTRNRTNISVYGPKSDLWEKLKNQWERTLPLPDRRQRSTKNHSPSDHRKCISALDAIFEAEALVATIQKERGCVIRIHGIDELELSTQPDILIPVIAHMLLLHKNSLKKCCNPCPCVHIQAISRPDRLELTFTNNVCSLPVVDCFDHIMLNRHPVRYLVSPSSELLSLQTRLKQLNATLTICEFMHFRGLKLSLPGQTLSTHFQTCPPVLRSSLPAKDNNNVSFAN